jgi:hypothetical protein
MSRIATPLAFTAIAVGAPLLSGCYIAAAKSEDTPSCLDPGCEPNPQSPGAAGGGGALDHCAGAAGDGAPAPGGAPAGADGGGGQIAGPLAPLPRAPSPPAGCPAVSVSRFKELMIVDPLVTGDPRAADDSSYRPWSFRERLEALVPGAPEAAGAIAEAWVAQWASLTDVPISTAPGAARVPVDPRPAADEVLRCPWLRQSPDNLCDASCASCRSRRVSLARSPFRLLAIVNRVDQATGGACGASGGELRFVYGAADPDTLQVLPFTVIFEYEIALQPGETARDWIGAWHELGSLTPGTAAFAARLDAVVSAGLARAALRRVLTNEVAFGAADGLPWEMRQFVPTLTDSGTLRLVEVATAGTPRLTLAGSPDLGQWIDDNAAAVLAGTNPLPAAMLAATAPIPSADFGWRTTASAAGAAAAFNHNTCNGCHGGRTDPADVPFQHIAPPALSRYGSAAAPRLSRFLHAPGYDDELGRRERQVATALCTPCGQAAY